MRGVRSTRRGSKHVYPMWTLLTRFFCTLGVIFFVLICGGVYVWFADPIGIRPIVTMLLQARVAESEVQHEVGTSTESTTSAIQRVGVFSPAQESALRAVGIDPATLPTLMTDARLLCAVRTIGSDRVAAIKAGDMPTFAELQLLRTCW